MVEGELGDVLHGLFELRTVGQLQCGGRGVEHLGRGQLGFVTGQIGAGGFSHVAAGGNTLLAVAAHGCHDFVPGAGQGLAQFRVCAEGIGVDHQQVDDLARNLRRVEHHGAAGLLADFAQQRVPGRDRGDIVGAVDRDHVGVRGVDHLHIGFAQAYRVQCAGQQVVGHAQLDQIDVLALDGGQFAVALEDDAVVAVGEVADDQCSAVDAAGGRNGQCIHVGHGAGVELAHGVLVDGLDVIVDLHHINVDVVLVGPFLDDAAFGAVGPGHPAGVDRPADLEAVLGLGCGRQQQGAEQQGGESFHREPLSQCHVEHSWQWCQSSPGLLSRRVTFV